jgi:hypothetical protein
VDLEHAQEHDRDDDKEEGRAERSGTRAVLGSECSE